MSLLSNLVSYWKLEESSGARVDSHGGNNLTPSGSPSNATGKIGSGIALVAASSQYAGITDNINISVSNQDFSICAWVKLTDKSTTYDIVGQWRDDGANQASHLLRYNAGSDRFEFLVSGDGTGGTTDSVVANNFGSPSAGTFYFITVVHTQGGTIKISVNAGTQDSTAHVSGAFNSTFDFRIGAHNSSPTSFMNGVIDEVGFWKKALTTTEITALYASGSGLQYPFGETTRGLANTSLHNDANLIAYYELENVNDSHGLSTLTNNNSVAFNAAKYLNGADYGASNTNKYLNIAGNLGINGNGDMSVSLWLKLQTEVPSGTYNLISLDSTSGADRYFRLEYQYNSGTRRLTTDAAAGGVINYNITLGTSNYYHIVVTRNISGDAIKLYVNGVLVGTGTGIGTSGGAANRFLIGANPNGPSDYNSAIFDDVAVFSKVLTPAEVALIYNGGLTGGGFFDIL